MKKQIIYSVMTAFFVGSAFNLSFADERSSNNADAQFREVYPKAMAGETGAMFTLGKIYVEGASSAGRDTAKGMELIQRASGNGNTNATKYMIDVYERSGSDKALELCQKLQKAGDKYCDKRMETLVEHSIPKTVSPNSCKKLNELYNAGNQGTLIKTEVTSCVLRGYSDTLSFDEAMSNLRMQAASDSKSFVMLMSFMLKEGSKEWDPLFVEENLSKAGLNFKDREVKDMFIKNAITFDGCRKMDRLKRENLRQRPSVCRMAARSGDEDAALYVGDAYLTGKDYFPEEPSEAALYIKEAVHSKNPAIAADAFVLLMNLYQRQGKFYEHFALAKLEIKGNTVNKRTALASLGYEAEYFKRTHSSMGVDDIFDLVALCDSPDVPQDFKSKVGRTIDEVIKDRGRLMKPIEKDSLNMYKEKLLTERDKAEIEAERAERVAVTAAQVGAQSATQSATQSNIQINTQVAQEAKRAEPKAEDPRVADDRTKRSEKTEKTVDKEPGLIERIFFNGSSR